MLIMVRQIATGSNVRYESRSQARLSLRDRFWGLLPEPRGRKHEIRKKSVGFQHQGHRCQSQKEGELTLVNQEDLKSACPIRGFPSLPHTTRLFFTAHPSVPA